MRGCRCFKCACLVSCYEYCNTIMDCPYYINSKVSKHDMAQILGVSRRRFAFLCGNCSLSYFIKRLKEKGYIVILDYNREKVIMYIKKDYEDRVFEVEMAKRHRVGEKEWQ